MEALESSKSHSFYFSQIFEINRKRRVLGFSNFCLWILVYSCFQIMIQAPKYSNTFSLFKTSNGQHLPINSWFPKFQQQLPTTTKTTTTNINTLYYFKGELVTFCFFKNLSFSIFTFWNPCLSSSKRETSSRNQTIRKVKEVVSYKKRCCFGWLWA